MLGTIIFWPSFKGLDSVRSLIQGRFDIVSELSIVWPDHQFATQICRFYGEKLSSRMIEAKRGRGFKATVFIVEDLGAEASWYSTRRGVLEINKNFLAMKKSLRSLGGSPWEVHASNSESEARVDFWLLTGRCLDRQVAVDYRGSVISELVGSEGWESVSQLAKTIELAESYILLRPEIQRQSIVSESDLDFLVKDRESFALRTAAKKLSRGAARSNYSIQIKNLGPINVDLHYLGDGYFDRSWQARLINQPVFHEGSGFFICPESDRKPLMLYHLLVHKTWSVVVKRRLAAMGVPVDLEGAREMLYRFMSEQDFSFEEPRDLTVGFNSNVARAVRRSRLRRWRESSRVLSRCKYRLARIIMKALNCWTRD